MFQAALKRIDYILRYMRIIVTDLNVFAGFIEEVGYVAERVRTFNWKERSANAPPGQIDSRWRPPAKFRWVSNVMERDVFRPVVVFNDGLIKPERSDHGRNRSEQGEDGFHSRDEHNMPRDTPN